MKKTRLFIFTIFVALSPFLKAQDYIKMKDGTGRSGLVNTDQIGKTGIIVLTDQEGNRNNYNATQISEITINDTTAYISLEIEYAVSNNEYRKDHFFTKRLIEGILNLDEVYAAPFDYAVTKNEQSKALQTISYEENGKNIRFKEYQGSFYIFTRDCEEDLRTNEIDDNLSSFIAFANLYNNCLNPDFVNQSEDRVVTRQEEIEISFGNTSVDIIGESTLNRDDEYEVSVQPSIRFRYKRSIINNNIFLGFGLSRLNHEIEQTNTPFRALTLTEVQVPVSIEYRSFSDVSGASVYTGFNIHTFVNGVDAQSYASLSVGGSAFLSPSPFYDLGFTVEYLHRIRPNDFEINPVQTFRFSNNVYLGVLFRYKVLDFE